MKVSVYRTDDLEQVRSILTHPAVYPFIVDDACKHVEEFYPVQHDDLHYLIALGHMEPPSDPVILGCFMIYATRARTYECHVAMLPCAYGFPAMQAAEAGIHYCFGDENFPLAEKITAQIPECNLPALRYAMSAGFQIEGINRLSFYLNGKLINQVHLGITRQDWLTMKKSAVYTAQEA